MVNLDQPQIYGKIDKQLMIKHIAELPQQIAQASEEIKDFTIPAHYIKIKNVVILGMGGSGIGGRLAAAYAEETAKIPIRVCADYTIPNFVNSDTLVIAVSYSGNTEEPLSAFQEAGKKQAKLLAITMGGELEKIASRLKAPLFKINYGSPPRAAIGYSYMAILGILQRLGVINFGKDEIKETVLLMEGLKTKLMPEVPIYQNEAKKIALKVEKSLPMVMGAGLFSPVAYRWVTQMSENGKHIGSMVELPELCHWWLVGLNFNEEIKKKTYVLILKSKNDHPRNKQRQNIIGQILRRKNIDFQEVVVAPSGGRLSDQMLMLYLGDFVSYYVGILHEINPSSIDEVDFLKKQLG